MAAKQTTPEVLWAQRSSATDPAKNYISLTISVPDVPKESLKLDLQPTKLVFTGHSGTKKTTYHVEIEFYAEIDPSESKIHHSARDVEMMLRKKEVKEEYWPRLLKDKAKVHYLKTDFDKWVDEDEQNEAPDDDYMNQLGGMPGMGGMGGMGGMPGMPGMGGMGGMGGMDFSQFGASGMEGLDMDDDDAGEDDDDEDAPELAEEDHDDEDAEVEDSASKGKGKAQSSSSGVKGATSGATGASATNTATEASERPKIEEIE